MNSIDDTLSFSAILERAILDFIERENAELHAQIAAQDAES